MYYIDSLRTLTRRDSSLVVPTREEEEREYYTFYSARTLSTGTGYLRHDSVDEEVFSRPEGTAQREIVVYFFESMLGHIVKSWNVIEKIPEETDSQIYKKSSVVTIPKKKKLSTVSTSGKTSKSKLAKVKSDIETVPMQLRCWWSAPDERAVIEFRNGNKYEGRISFKCMHGEGRFQWNDGTVYMGPFEDNEITGRGKITWKDDTWYEGEFVNNIRHGSGLYVDSRLQRFYTGGWNCGTKHGEGAIYYSMDHNSYDGEWDHNKRVGYGAREYSKTSGYKGEWDSYVQEGQGLMIWPNCDFYKGEWKNGLMSGYGIYIWDNIFNNTMSLPSLNSYRGHWVKGLRNGYGQLNMGCDLGAHYEGNFNGNKKHGPGKYVSNNGYILQDKHLFLDDILGSSDNDNPSLQEQFILNSSDESFGLLYHVYQALKNIDKEVEIREKMVNDFLVNNNSMPKDPKTYIKVAPAEAPSCSEVADFIIFEEMSLRKAIKCHERELHDIYYKYATICNTEDINFKPILIKLYLWQFYYDCNVHDKGLYLVEIDNMFHQNPDWQSISAHDPFEKVHFWQFIHSLVTVASRLYGKKEMPGPKPDSILGNAFRMFMTTDVLAGVGCCKGLLTQVVDPHVPLKGVYNLYRSIGEPHTIRSFLFELRRPDHDVDSPQPALVENSDEALPYGKNVYMIGDEMCYVVENLVDPSYENVRYSYPNLKLYNFGNLSTKAVIKIFSQIFPNVFVNDKIVNLDTELAFFEFFEVFLTCAAESIKVERDVMEQEIPANHEDACATSSRHLQKQH